MIDFEMEKQKGLLYAQMPEHKYLVSKTKGFIKWALEQVENPYVACSFGKDSAVMLHLVLAFNENIPVRFIRWKNETEHLSNYDEVIRAWNLKNLTQIELQRFSLDEKHKERYSTSDYDSYFIGFRKDEAKGRRITLRKDGKFFKMTDGKYRVSPLANWKIENILAYTVENNLPILDTYKKYGFNQRTTSRVPREDFGIRMQSLKLLKHKNNSAFIELSKHFPEIGAYV